MECGWNDTPCNQSGCPECNPYEGLERFMEAMNGLDLAAEDMDLAAVAFEGQGDVRAPLCEKFAMEIYRLRASAQDIICAHKNAKMKEDK